MVINRDIIKMVIHRQRIRSWLIYIFCAGILFYNGISLQLYPQLYSFSFFLLCAAGSLRILYSFFDTQNIRDIYLLPIPLHQIYGNLLLALLIDTLMGKYLPFIILLSHNGQLIFLINLGLISILSILISFIYVWKGKKTGIYLLVYFGVLIVNISLIYIALIVLTIYLILQCKNPISIEISNSHQKKYTNYFYGALIHNRYFWINSSALVVFIGLLVIKLSDLESTIFLSIMFSVITINSPILTMLSIDKDTRRQIKLSPQPMLILRQYFVLLLIYFILGNTCVCLILLISGHINFYVNLIVNLGVLSILEAFYSVWIEYCHPIKHDKKEQIWKSPRKYILLILAYLFNFIFI